MSNASLKEQLEALSLASAETASKKDRHFNKPNRNDMPNRHNKPGRNEKKLSPQQKPAWLEYAQYGVELLKAHFPLCFRDIKEIQPLKIGIKQDLVKVLSTREDIVIGDKACMVSSLSYYVNSTAYHKSVVEGAMRIDLGGNSAGLISVEESQYSLDCRKAKLDKKKSPANPAKILEPASQA